MNSRDWLRAMVLRDRRKTTPATLKPQHPVTNDSAEGSDTMPSGIITSDRELSEADVEQWRIRFREATAAAGALTPKLPPPPQRAANGWNCGCQPRYSRCYCPPRP